jgi:hypothetical protein
LNANRNFNLDPQNCQLVRGYTGAAIYDFTGGTVLAVPPELRNCLHPAAGSFMLGPAHNLVEHPFMLLLQAKALGRFDSVCAEAEEVVAGPSEATPDFCWLEVTPHCNLHCVHCYGAFGPPVHEPDDLLTSEEW